MKTPPNGCVLPPEVYAIKLDKQSQRFFVEGTDSYLSLRSKVTAQLKTLDAVVNACEPSWKGTWSASFFADQNLAGYKTDSDVQEAVKSGRWFYSYVGEFDRKTSVLTISPLDPWRRRTERLNIH